MFTDKMLLDAYPFMVKFAHKLTNGNKERAEDLVQSTALRVIEKRTAYVEGNPRGWTGKIMYNIFVSEYRRSSKFESKNHDEGIFERVATRERQEDILCAKQVAEHMRVLPYEFKEVLGLAMEGLEYADIAQLVGIPLGTVRSRLSRGREMLRLSSEAA